MAAKHMARSDFKQAQPHENKMRKQESSFYMHKLVRMGEEWTDDQVDRLIKTHETVTETGSVLSEECEAPLPPPQKIRKKTTLEWTRAWMGRMMWGDVGARVTTGGKIHNVGEKRPYETVTRPTVAPTPSDVTASHWVSMTQREAGELHYQPSMARCEVPLLASQTAHQALSPSTKIVVDLPDGFRQAEVVTFFPEESQYSVRFSDGGVETHPVSKVRKLLM
eukprot:TRINITY_DN10251_c0_g1_i2.p1 TRINITY_DN10251_c0_g1~~TRINITY_DN10251_c0_g1_i2.p1  ORF type:complete len:222 (+),score=35.81 TRINITY_DN10251_c0_g1_i2:47-712(+)